MNKKIFWWGGVGLFLVAAIAIMIAGNRTEIKGSVTTFSASDANAPRVASDHTEWDLGEVPFEPPTEHRTTFKNTGKSKLTLTGAQTSCGCTSVTFTIPGKGESPRFEMHNNPEWKEDVEPGQEVTLNVRFDPKAHNIHGEVERTIVVSSNDPVNPNFQFSFKAKVIH